MPWILNQVQDDDTISLCFLEHSIGTMNLQIQADDKLFDQFFRDSKVY